MSRTPIDPASAVSREAEPADAPAIWELIEAEIEVMGREGRDQWQHGYPNPDIISADIAAHRGHVLTLPRKDVVGYCCLLTNGDQHYDQPLSGQWITTSHSRCCRYSVIHRMAIDSRLTGRGLAQRLFWLMEQEALKRGLESVRVDTNHDNAQMLHIVQKLGYTRCCLVMLDDGERIGFEKVLTHAHHHTEQQRQLYNNSISTKES